MKKRLLTGFAAMVLTLTGCTGGGGAPGTQVNTPAQPQAAGQQGVKPAEASLKVVYLPVDSSTPLLLAIEKFAPEFNLKVELLKANSGGEALAQVGTGSAQVGNGALGAAGFNALQQGLPVKYVMPGHYDWSTNVFVVAKNIRSGADLKGKKVAVNARGVATEWMLAVALGQWGLTMKDVEIVTMPFPDMPAAMENGSIVGGTLTEPIASLAEEKGVGYRPFAHDPKAQKLDPITMIFYNADWAAKNRDVAVRFAAAYMKAAQYLDAEGGKGWLKEDVLKLREKYGNLKPALAHKVRPTKIPADLAMDVAGLQDQQKFAQDLGYLKYDKLMAPEKYLDTSFVEEARQLVK